jgi:glycosyltransferase involved in cell wall biosynthesis
MKFLFCCEFYHPSVGGVQEVIKQIAERMVQRGHQVTVATTALENRTFKELNGVKIEEFSISGNLVNGYAGEINRYREFVVNFSCDTVLIKAAQQWTFDTLWAEFSRLKCRKVFIPCGFSAFYDPRYQAYFKALPNILAQFDRLIFYSDNYRDINFARKNNLTNLELIPNGASEIEFDTNLDPTFRERFEIPENSFIIFTVGSLTGAKGHTELAEAVYLLKENGNHVTLILNGNDPSLNRMRSATENIRLVDTAPSLKLDINSRVDIPNKSLEYKSIAWISEHSVVNDLTKVLKFLVRNFFKPHKVVSETLRHLGIQRKRSVELIPDEPLDYESTESVLKLNLSDLVLKINQSSSNKRALLTDFSRDQLIQAYLNADLFVFASQIEYSPLVLFEAAASGTPFLTTPVGNAEELIGWLGGGFLIEAEKDVSGYLRVKPDALALEVAVLMSQKPMLQEMGRAMKSRWRHHYTWDTIASEYERVLTDCLDTN